MRSPGPDHPITVEPFDGRVVADFAGRRIADTLNALVMTESTYAPVYYFPIMHVDRAVLAPSEHTTYCPYKGEATYFSLVSGGASVENAVWRYLDAYPAVAAIAGRVAFYTSHVTVTAMPTRRE